VATGAAHDAEGQRNSNQKKLVEGGYAPGCGFQSFQEQRKGADKVRAHMV
jgi:hypothetical protein